MKIKNPNTPYKNFPLQVRVGDDSGSNFEFGLIENALYILSTESGSMPAKNNAGSLAPLVAGEPVELSFTENLG
jgi:hypothetical protein